MADTNKCLEQMNESLYNKIIKKISKVVKKSINEAYSENSIYDTIYNSFDELNILNDSGNIGDILQKNLFGEFRVKQRESVMNESMFDDIDFDDKQHVSIKMSEWKNFAICFDTGLWVYLDWIGLTTNKIWALCNNSLFDHTGIHSSEGYRNTQRILFKYKNCIKGTVWNDIQKCEYPIYIPSNEELKYICNAYSSEDYIIYVGKLFTLKGGSYWTSNENDNYEYVDIVRFPLGRVTKTDKDDECRSIALLHFK